MPVDDSYNEFYHKDGNDTPIIIDRDWLFGTYIRTANVKALELPAVEHFTPSKADHNS